MNKTIVRITSMLLALNLALSVFIPGQAKPESAGLMSSGVINLAHFYKPPSNSNAGTVVGNFNFMILSGGDEAFRDQLIAKGYTNTILQYFGSVGIQDPGSCAAQPRLNQVAYGINDFCWISQYHPEWFLLNNKGQRILASPGSDTYRMDLGNPAWRKFFTNRVIKYQASKGWSGLFLDNLEASLSFIQRDGHTLAKYPTDASYQAAIRGFLEYLKTNYSQTYNRPVVTNIIARRDESSWFGYMPYLDGAMQESWAVDWSPNGYVSTEKWKSDLALAEKTQSQGKHIVLVSQGGQADTNRQNFAYASYLLISNGKAAFRYGSAANYRQVWLYNNYQVNLGTPLGPRYQTGTSWRRDFTGGYVIVDPVNHTATISTSTVPATPIPSPTPPIQPPAAGGTTYDDKNALLVYSSGWQRVSDARAHGGSFSVASVNGAHVTFPFTGESFSILYKGGVIFETVDVLVDGAWVARLNQKLPAPAFQQRWDYPGKLPSGQHTLKLIFRPSTGNGRGSVDAVMVR
jgi:hypothetical protein